MTTAEAIEGITDAGAFEILATRVLRIKDDDCRFMEHMGVNAQGKTISNPIDGFCRVPGIEPPRFVMTAFTTCKTESLEHKWLFNHAVGSRGSQATDADDGDLIKAAKYAEEICMKYQTARFVCYLCTNKQPDEELIMKVYSKGAQLRIEVRFLTRSQLRDFLDTTPDGQWLRKQHLGIEAERLSFPLLQELSHKSLEFYGKDFSFVPPQTFVNTSLTSQLIAFTKLPKSMHIITGTSGSGKSVACYQLLRDHLAENGVGLWIPGEIATRASSLEEAIGLTLHSLYPMLEPNAASVAMQFLTSSRRLFLIIDDINRGKTPSESLRRIVTWASRTKSDKKKTSTPFLVLVMPVWDLLWAPVEIQFREAEWLIKIPVTMMSKPEALACLVSSLGPCVKQFANADLQRIVDALGNDPILIAMYADLAQAGLKSNAFSLASEVMERFVDAAIKEAVVSGDYLATEYQAALSHLATQLLIKRDLYPCWEYLEHWLSDKDLSAIRILAHSGKICHITNRGGEECFEFRHDRIMEHYFTRALRSMFADPELNIDILSDPFYASFVGRAAASMQISSELINWMKQHAPLALAAAFRFSSSSDSNTRLIAVAVKDLCDSVSKKSHLVWHVSCFLKETDSSFLLAVTQSLREYTMIRRARLANGEALAGCDEFSDIQWFAPAVNDQDMDAVLSRALHHHRQRLIMDCAKLLQMPDLSEPKRRGALILAGFIGDVSLAVAVKTVWTSIPNKLDFLLPALWAGFRCGGNAPSAILDEMMVFWATLSDDQQKGDYSERMIVAQELQFAVRRGLSESILQYLIVIARKNDALRRVILMVLEHLDHPLVVKFLVEEAAEIEQQTKKKGNFSPWLMILRDNWDPTNSIRGRRLSLESVEAIKACWESGDSPPHLSETAFRFWIRTIDSIKILCSISPDHPQFSAVLWRRATLGDVSVVPMIKPLLSTEDKWFHVLGRVWTQECREPLDHVFLKLEKSTQANYSGEITNTHFMLAHLLRDIPVAEAQPMLLKHWGFLQFCPPFIHVALYHGTPETKKIAESAIEKFPKENSPFKHIGAFFGFFVSDRIDRLNLQHLETLRTYLDCLDDHDLWEMAEFCERRGYYEWSKNYLKPEFNRRRLVSSVTKDKQTFIERLGRIHFPTDNDLLEELNQIEKKDKHFGGIYYWSEGFVRRHDNHERWRSVLDKWISHNPTLKCFHILADAVLEHGTRGDLDLLNKYSISGDLKEVEFLKVNAKFGVMRRSLN